MKTAITSLFVVIPMALFPLFQAAGPGDYPMETGVRCEPVELRVVAPNAHGYGSPAAGILYTPVGKTPKTAVILIHPEADVRMDWHCIPLAKTGFATFGMALRYAKENHHCIMEEEVLDIAEAIRFLKQERGFTHVILHGHSGGGSTVALYQSQAEKQPPNRLSSTPAGDPPDLNKFELPKADGLIISAAHLGRGWAVARRLDPSVVDEDDPLSVDPSVDPFDPANGYRPPPESSHYSEDFLQRFNAAQEARMQRLIQKAFGVVRERQMYQKMLQSPEFRQMSAREQLKVRRGAVVQRYMTIYRNYANLYLVDSSVDPNDRVLSGKPDETNYFGYFHPRTTTPEAFLSLQFNSLKRLFSKSSSGRNGACVDHPGQCRPERPHVGIKSRLQCGGQQGQGVHGY